MKLVTNPDFKPSKEADRTALAAFLDGKADADFDAIRAGVASLKNKTDGEIHQIAIDAGLDVMP